MPPVESASKRELRRAIVSQRRRLPLQNKLTANKSLLRALILRLRAAAPRIIAAYAPLPTEPGGSQMLKTLRTLTPSVQQILLPVQGSTPDWAEYRGEQNLTVTSASALRQPTTPRLGPHAVREAEFLIVPALAVDHRGARLGRGGGYYDRVLQLCDAGMCVALLFDSEFLEQLPSEPHDVPVNAVVTPTDGWVDLEHR